MNDSQINNMGSVFRFWVEFDAIQVAGFTKVSGITVSTEIEEYHEGGLNNYTHHFPKRTKYQNIVLKKGISSSYELWDWYKDVINGKINKKNISIVLQNHRGEEIWRWNLLDAYPVKWIGSELNAESSEVAIETLEIVYGELRTIEKERVVEK